MFDELTDLLFTVFWTGIQTVYAPDDPPVIDWGLKGFEPPVGAPYFRPTIRPGTSFVAATSSVTHRRHPGQCIVQCFYPVIGGDSQAARDEAYAMGQKVTQAVQGQSLDGDPLGTTSLVDVGITESWYQVNAVTPFERNLTS